MLVDVGDTLPAFGFSVTSNETGALVDPATFAVVLTAPDGVRSATLTHPGVGLYAVEGFVADVVGTWVAVGTAVGNDADGVSTLTWQVRSTAAQAQPLISVEDARTLLGLTADAARDEKLRAYCAAATRSIERRTGRTYRQQAVVETHLERAPALALHRTPVQSVTSVTDRGAAATGYTVDLNAGVLIRSRDWPEAEWVGPTVVTYVAGPDSVDDDVLAAVRLSLQHLWSTQGGASGAPRRATGADPLAVELAAAIARLDVAPGFA